jgi:outer membrane protein insertion porin family
MFARLRVANIANSACGHGRLRYNKGQENLASTGITVPHITMTPRPILPRLLLSCMLASTMLAAPAMPALAQAPAVSRVTDVMIKGNQRVEQSTIISYLGIQPGSSIGQYELDNALKKLFETGFFYDVQIIPHQNASGGTALEVVVIENPVVSRVTFEGNRTVEDKDIQAELEIKPRVIYTRSKVQLDTRRILDLYRRQGRYSATAEPKIIQRDQNRVDIVFEINEGPKAKVEQIDFVGNQVFSSSDLRRAVRTEETAWYKFFSSNDTYDTDRMQFDQELLRRFYVGQGYADFQVKSAVAELSPARDAFNVVFTIEEGAQYTFGTASVQSKLQGVDGESLQTQVQMRQGDIYDAGLVESTVDAIVKALGDRGYAFVDVQPEFNRNPQTRTIDITFTVNESPKVYVERIDIKGNSRTLDSVVRREFRLAEGDPYNTSKLARTEQRLTNLGYFGKVAINNKPGSAPDKTVLDVEVEERSTGELSLGGGFSSVDGALADFGIRETNLLGRGQDLRLRAMLAQRRQQYDIGFTEPYFLDRELSAGMDLFKTSQDFRRESSFDRESNGGRLRLGYALSEHIRHTFNYTLDDTTISNIHPLASRYIRDQEGSLLTSSVGQSLVYDTRDNRFDPTTGMVTTFRQDIAGLGGDAKFLRHEIEGAYYYPVAKEWTWMVGGSFGHIMGMNDDVRIQNRFFVGERQVRGFNNLGIGPRDLATNDALGGNMYYTGTTELLFPLGLPEEMGFRGVVFTDIASLWDIDNAGPGIADSNSMRLSAGVGVAWRSPFGPIRVDFAKAFLKEDYDETQMVRFSFGTRF